MSLHQGSSQVCTFIGTKIMRLNKFIEFLKKSFQYSYIFLIVRQQKNLTLICPYYWHATMLQTMHNFISNKLNHIQAFTTEVKRFFQNTRGRNIESCISFFLDQTCKTEQEASYWSLVNILSANLSKKHFCIHYNVVSKSCHTLYFPVKHRRKSCSNTSHYSSKV